MRRVRLALALGRAARTLAAGSALLLAVAAQAAPTRSSPLAVDAAGRAFVVNTDAGTVARVAFAPAAGGGVAGTREAEAQVGSRPRTVAVSGGAVFVVDQAGDAVTRLDATTLGDARTRPLGAGCAPYGVAARPDGAGVVVSCQGTSELVLLTPDLAETARVALPWSQARAVAVSDAGEAYVTHFLTEEPNDDGHVSVVDLATGALARVLAIPPDTVTCETQNSGQGVANQLSTIALVPDDAPAAVRGQVWVGGIQQNVRKGLFARERAFGRTAARTLFPALPLASFPDGATVRNPFHAEFHDVARFGLWKLDRTTGVVVGRVDVDQGGVASDVEIAPDGAVAYVVDAFAHAYHVFNTLRGQDGNPTTVFASPSARGPGGAEPSADCVADPLRAIVGEAPFRLPPQAQLTVRDPDPVRPTGDADAPFAVVATGVDWDAGHHLVTGGDRMVAVPDGVGTGPVGVRLAPDGAWAAVASALSRTVVAMGAAGPGDGFRCGGAPAQTCATPDDCAGPEPACLPLVLSEPVATIAGGDGRCAGAPGVACTRADDCPAEPGFCNGDGRACGADADCTAGDACVVRAACVVLRGDVVPPALLDGHVLFATVARDASVTNGGLAHAAPRFDDPARLGRVPGAAVSVARQAAYVSCATCHADDGGQDGRTWDFSQLGTALRNTPDLRGRSNVAPGRCADAPDVVCTCDAACGPGGVCRMDPALVPPHVAPADRARWFNPMLSAHWSGDRDEVEDFEHTYRSLMGAGDCDGAEYSAACQGALVQRSADASADPVDVHPPLGPPNRNLRGPRGTAAGVRLSHVADFVYAQTAFPTNPRRADPAAVALGRRVFHDPVVGCASCHAGPSAARELYTDRAPNPGFDAARAADETNSPFVRHDVGTANVFDATDPFAVASARQVWQNAGNPPDVRTIPATRAPATAFVTPLLVDAWATPPYLHDGSAATLLDVVRPCDADRDACLVAGRGRNLVQGGTDAHGRTSWLTPAQLDALAAFVASVDGARPPEEGGLGRRPGRLAVRRVALDRTGEGRLAVSGRLDDVPVAAGELVTVSVGMPLGARMEVASWTVRLEARPGRLVGVVADGTARGRVTFRRRPDGGWRMAVAVRGPGLRAPATGARDVTVAVEAGDAQAAATRVVTGRRRLLRTRGTARPGLTDSGGAAMAAPVLLGAR